MAQSDAHTARNQELDDLLRTDHDTFVTPEDDFYRWYTRLLSTLSVLTVGDDITYAASVLPADGTARFVVFTATSVIVADVKDVTDHHERVVARSVARHRIRNLDVAASMQSNVRGSTAAGWPGVLRLELTYDGWEEPIVVEGNSYDRYNETHIASIWTLLDALRADMRATLAA